MNHSKIEWTEHTWNPVTGCKRDCLNCYAKKQSLRFSGDIRTNLLDERCKGDRERELYVLDKPFATRNDHFLNTPFGFAPTLHTYRLESPGKYKNGTNIFVCSLADLFGPWVPDEWIMKVFESCEKWKQHNYLFLTKYPQRYSALHANKLLPGGDNYWFGTTIERPEDEFFSNSSFHTFLKIEPILEPLKEEFNNLIKRVDWVIVGAGSENNACKAKPQSLWIDEFLEQCDFENVPVFLKANLQSVVGEKYDQKSLQQYPEQLTTHSISSKLKNKLYDRCGFCKQEHKKKDMVALLSREKRGAGAVSFGYACPACFNTLQEIMNSNKVEKLAKEEGHIGV